jgi:hypothetical protein
MVGAKGRRQKATTLIDEGERSRRTLGAELGAERNGYIKPSRNFT